MSNEEKTIVITSAVRTPIGNFQGCFQDLSATDLGSIAIRGAINEANLQPTEVNAAIMGCVLPAGLGQAPARQAALKAGLPTATDCLTVNKVCGSGMKSVMLAYDQLLTSSSNDVFVAGGMESMSNAPYLLPKARSGYRLGHHEILDHLFFDGLEDAYEKGKLMGKFAELCANQYQFTRQEQDAFALGSLQKALAANEQKFFKEEIIPVTVTSKRGQTSEVTLDEGPLTAKPEKIPLLRPAFQTDGTVTAANASSISDGAAAITLMTMATADKLQLKPIAKVLGHATHSQQPAAFTTAPIYAIEKLLKQLSWDVSSVDLWEINEAFAVVVMAAIKELCLPPEKVNIHGGACVLGHPIGASGARILVTLIHALRQHRLKRGIASLCIGGGEATAIAVEIL